MGPEGVSRMNLTVVAGGHCSIHQQGLGPGPKHPHAEEEGIGTWQPMSGYNRHLVVVADCMSLVVVHCKSFLLT